MDQYIGEIRIFSGNFPPAGWAFCNGALLPITRNTALFSILGVRYGGDGKTTFALPNLNGATPMGQGSGPGLTPRDVGEAVGEETITLIETEMPAHTHQAQGQSTADSMDPTGTIWADIEDVRHAPHAYGPTANTIVNMQALVSTGGSQPHNNMQPYLGLSFIIALEGVFPARP